jgi:GntR family transcriptional regulator/MocR family aminotransferase
MAAGDEVWFEDPGYHLARQALTAADTRLIPVRIDEEGMRIADGMVHAPRARFVVVTPSHQPATIVNPIAARGSISIEDSSA